jgi:hypothetical protein
MKRPMCHSSHYRVVRIGILLLHKEGNISLCSRDVLYLLM